MNSVEFKDVTKGNKTYKVPSKLIRYCITLPEEKRKACMDWYIIMAAQRPSTVIKFIERYHNIWATNFGLCGLEDLIATEEGTVQALGRFEHELEKKTQGHFHADLFMFFKPLVAGFLDPAYILYTIATRRPDLYRMILNKDGGFEWVRNLIRRLRARQGMGGELMMEIWEMQIVMPSTKKMLEKLDELEKAGKLPEGF